MHWSAFLSRNNGGVGVIDAPVYHGQWSHRDPSEQNNRQTPVKALPSCNCGNKYCESFTRWPLDTSRHEDMLVHKSDILAFPLPVSAKKSNGFDYSR